MPYNSDNVGIAFGLVIAAGASTGIGAAVVFFPRIVKLASRRVLAGSLGFSAGVMAYVSFIEIFQKARISFEDSGLDEGKAYSYATLCFFGGVMVMMLLNVVVSYLLGGHSHRHDAVGTPHEEEEESHDHPDHEHHKTTRADLKACEGDIGYSPPCCTKDPIDQLDRFHKMASVLEHERSEGAGDDADDDDSHKKVELDIEIEDNFGDQQPLKEEDDDKNEEQTNQGTEVLTEEESEIEKKRLVKMGMNTALAIGLHNFPEGLATFVAALNDPKVGTVLAVAIAIHNIPEGLCVALPIFYATGNRTKAFLWACLSGFSEILAALLGWLILANLFSDVAYAVLFGLVAGMMVIISIRELLPTAHFYDPEDTVVTHSFIGGMVLIALSLVLFQI